MGQRVGYALPVPGSPRFRAAACPAKNVAAAQFAPPDFLLFRQSGRLMAQKFDWTEARPAEAALAIAGPKGPKPPTPAQFIGSFSASQNGILAYRTGSPVARDRLVWHSRDGHIVRTAGEPGHYMEAFLSPDGISVAVNLGNAKGNLGLLNLATNTMSQLTADGPIVYDAVWSPDSRSLVHQIYTPPKTRIMKLTFGQPSPEVLLDDGSISFPDAWSPDGKWILARKQAGSQNTIFLLAADESLRIECCSRRNSLLTNSSFRPMAIGWHITRWNRAGGKYISCVFPA